MENDQVTMEHLAQLCTETDLLFDAAFDAMPPVPLKLPAEYKFVAQYALVNECQQAAPYMASVGE